MKCYLKLRQLIRYPQYPLVDPLSAHIKLEGALVGNKEGDVPAQYLGDIELRLVRIEDEELFESLMKGDDIAIEIQSAGGR